jgi:micrococcal nuclease
MYEYRIKKVVKVVDGDTVDLEIDLGFSLTKKERCRIAGIDTPECRTRNKAEKQYGQAAKLYMTGLLKNAKELKVRTEKDGKYGRMLGWIYADDNELSLNEQMVVDGYAWQYDGGTKREFDKDKWILDDRRKSI